MCTPMPSTYKKLSALMGYGDFTIPIEYIKECGVSSRSTLHNTFTNHACRY